ncbi:leucyl/phenylalanyl-tRNA--protein transferase [Paracoccaceae bacterium GXU_MW_L88]
MNGLITPADLLTAYRRGWFPMAESETSPDFKFYEPRMRGLIPIGKLHISRSLARSIRKNDYVARVESDFLSIMGRCGQRREGSWINAPLLELYSKLNEIGHAEALGVYDGETRLGGIYGVVIGGAFFGESMFSDATNGSKLALVAVMDRLVAGGFMLFDTQFLTDHLASMGGVEIPQPDYMKVLPHGLEKKANFFALPRETALRDALVRLTPEPRS